MREIGTLRSLGFRRRHVVALFTMESALLALVSSGLGLLATWLLTGVINGADLAYDAGMAATPIPLTVGIVPGAYVFAVIFLSGVAVLAAIVPARRAARLSIPDALGHVSGGRVGGAEMPSIAWPVEARPRPARRRFPGGRRARSDSAPARPKRRWRERLANRERQRSSPRRAA